MTRQGDLPIKNILIFLLLTIVVSCWFYYRYLHTPKKILQNTLHTFENSITAKDITTLQNIVSEKAVIYKYLDSPELQAIFDDYHPGMEVVTANYTAGSHNLSIYGKVKMKAKIDGEYREFDKLYIEKEQDVWKIRQFVFPSYFNK